MVEQAFDVNAHSQNVTAAEDQMEPRLFFDPAGVVKDRAEVKRQEGAVPARRDDLTSR